MTITDPHHGPELVVLLNNEGTEIGTAQKYAIHTAETPLHLAFSCHVYDSAGRILLTRRALSKKTWGGVWTNSFCGHPGPGESFEDAINRRAAQELGMMVSGITPVLPGFRYRAVDASGVVENEICPVYRATIDGGLQPVPEEVAECAWCTPEELRSAIEAAPFAFSPWLVEQVAQGALGS
ncbi:isopentenyl-diphosphate Delta-isomerase [Paeniglutamicibacter cryotolerans]|uniref:Isopentenyl-diphosphate Delta-isomerase n=1 Tax=Paeniglutamicibacter cryotolerans TaxID=670079 RepID=A0A839QKP9_9MICC|nr:isopentenyl-diphosphate Delta-isomerase [Paeniglutamicibacter cryotolerans]MBB2994606.1 isopentenyl-diphosphate delta-isomerase [Paeniglutamicibacter cryotolerans]